jgi:hypothetical protein
VVTRSGNVGDHFDPDSIMKILYSASELLNTVSLYHGRWLVAINSFSMQASVFAISNSSSMFSKIETLSIT